MGKYAGWIIGGIAALVAYFVWRSSSSASAGSVPTGDDTSSSWDVGPSTGYNVSGSLSGPIGNDQPASVPTPTGDLPGAPPPATTPTTTPTLSPPPGAPPPAPKAPVIAPPPVIPPLAPVLKPAATFGGGVNGDVPTLSTGPARLAPIGAPMGPTPVPATPFTVTAPTTETRTGKGHF